MRAAWISTSLARCYVSFAPAVITWSCMRKTNHTPNFLPPWCLPRVEPSVLSWESAQGPRSASSFQSLPHRAIQAPIALARQFQAPKVGGATAAVECSKLSRSNQRFAVFAEDVAEEESSNAANSTSSTFLVLETIFEENSDDLETDDSDSVCSHLSDTTDDDFESVIHISPGKNEINNSLILFLLAFTLSVH